MSKYTLFYYNIKSLRVIGVYDEKSEAISKAEYLCKKLANVYFRQVKENDYPNNGIEIDNMKYNIRCEDDNFIVAQV